MTLALIPRLPFTIRPGTLADVAFIDSLQKQNSRAVGFFPTRAIEGKIALGHVLVAEGDGGAIGYLIGNDQYYKRDDLGCIFQINVRADYRRSLVAASLLKAQFDRSAYGCRLYCCWCAQDLEANRFWEAMGFMPLAYRAGSKTRGVKGSVRRHIFWQKRIRAGDATTPWWFPAKTTGGALAADRLVLPIPPGMTWRDELPVLLTAAPSNALPAPRSSRKKTNQINADKTTVDGAFAKRGPVKISTQRWSFGPSATPEPVEATEKKEKSARPKREKTKADPALAAKARELRDRYLEQVNASPDAPTTPARYAIERAADGRVMLETMAPRKQLAA